MRARGPVSALQLDDQAYGILPVEVDVTVPDPNDPPGRDIVASLQMAWLLAGKSHAASPPNANLLTQTPRAERYAVRGLWSVGGSTDAPWDPLWTHFMGEANTDVALEPPQLQAETSTSVTGLPHDVYWRPDTLMKPGTPAQLRDPGSALPVDLSRLPATPPAQAIRGQLAALAAADRNGLQQDAQGIDGPDSLLRVFVRTALLRYTAGDAHVPPEGVSPLALRGRLDGEPDEDVIDSTAQAYASVAVLAERDPDALGRLLAETVELGSTAWHAWATALATRRVAQARRSGVTGVVLGGYGIVNRPAPASTPPSYGYLRAPSVRQAATAAILFNGHLRHASDTTSGLRSPMSVDLSSARARLAQQLVAGMRAGQRLGALLGYRFERTLQDAGLGEYIAPLRFLAPLDPSADGSPTAATATDVIDGLALSRLRHAPTSIPWNSTVGNHLLGGPEPVTAALDDLDTACDAVSDALLAEGVDAATSGRTSQAFAAFEASARGSVAPPELSFLDSPVTGVDVTHRVLALAPDTGEDDWPRTPRTASDPALAAWAAAALGPPETCVIVVQVVAADGLDTPQTLSVPIANLGLGPVDLIAIADQPGELDTLLRWHVATTPALADQLSSDTTVRCAPMRAQIAIGVNRPFVGVSATARAIAALLGHARAIDGRDLALPGATDARADLNDLRGRVAALWQQVTNTRNTLQELAAADVPDPGSAAELTLRDQLRTALEAAWRVGVTGALAADPLVVTAMQTVAGTSAARLAARLAKVPDVASVPDDLGSLSDAMATLRADRFPVLPLLTFAGATGLAAAAAATSTSGAPAGQGPLAWFDRVASVSTAIDALRRVWACRDLIDTAGGVDLHIAQLPVPDQGTQPWIGLPLSEASRADRASLEPRVSLTLLGPPPRDGVERLAGLMIDSWAETIPSTTEIAGLTFHHETPQAQPPQVALVVAPTGDPTGVPWSAENLGRAVNTAMTLSLTRLAESSDLPSTPLTPVVYLNGSGPPPGGLFRGDTGIPIARLAGDVAGLGLVETKGRPTITRIAGSLQQGGAGQVVVTGQNLLSAAFTVNVGGSRTVVTARSDTETTVQITLPLNSALTVTLTAATPVGQARADVSVTAAPRLLGVNAPTTISQGESASTCDLTLTGTGLPQLTGVTVALTDGSSRSLRAVLTRQTSGPDGDQVVVTISVPGEARPVSDWDPSKPGSPLKPPMVVWSRRHHTVGMVITLTSPTGASFSTAGLTPSPALAVLSWKGGGDE